MAQQYSSANKRKKTFATIKYVLMVIVALAISVGVGAGVFLKVSTIQVEGAYECNPEEIIKLSGIEKGDSLMLINENDAVLKIRNQMSVIKDIKIETSFPGTVKIVITENRAIAYFKFNEAYYAIDSSCKILRKYDLAPLELMLIKGIIPANPTVGDKLTLTENGASTVTVITDFITAVENQKSTGKVSDIDFTDNANLTFTYGGRFAVNFGRPENCDSKLKLIINAAGKLGDDDTGSINIVSDTEARFVPGQQGQ